MRCSSLESSSGSSESASRSLPLSTMALALPPASVLTAGESSVTVTLCCSTSTAMEMSTRLTWPAASWMVGEAKGAKPSKVALHDVAAGREAGDRIAAGGIRGGGGHHDSRCGGDGDAAPGIKRAGGVGDVAAQSGRCGRRRGRRGCWRMQLRGRLCRPLRGAASARAIKNDECYAILSTRVPRLFPMNDCVRLLSAPLSGCAGAHAPVVEQALAGRGSLEQRLNAGQQRDGGNSVAPSVETSITASPFFRSAS